MLLVLSTRAPHRPSNFGDFYILIEGRRGALFGHCIVVRAVSAAVLPVWVDFTSLKGLPCAPGLWLGLYAHLTARTTVSKERSQGRRAHRARHASTCKQFNVD